MPPEGKGIPTQLTQESLKDWKEEYDILKKSVPIKPADATEVFIVGKMVMKHPEINRDYALATRGAAKPTKMDDALDVLLEILTDDQIAKALVAKQLEDESGEGAEEEPAAEEPAA